MEIETILELWEYVVVWWLVCVCFFAAADGRESDLVATFHENDCTEGTEGHLVQEIQ